MNSDTDIPSNPLRQALLLREMLLSIARNRSCDNAMYVQLRTNLMENPSIARALVPSYVKICRSEGHLWDHLNKVRSGKGAYEARQNYIYETLQPLLDELETKHATQADLLISEFRSSFDSDGIRRAWDGALELGTHDPESAIAAARMLLDTVFKHILDEAGECHSYNDYLPKLLVRTSWLLSFAPSRETEDEFRAILGACQTAVQKLCIVCETKSPTPRHAALAVNLAASMATFVVETWQARSAEE